MDLYIAAVGLGGFLMAAAFVANGVFALISPTAWMSFSWHGIRGRWRGVKERDLDTLGGRLKIIVNSLLGIAAGLLGMLLFGLMLFAAVSGRAVRSH